MHAYPKYIVDFATALLLDENIDGCIRALAALDDQDHPTARQLRAAIDGWRGRLTFAQKLALAMGFQPDVPIELGFPPGEV